MVASWGRGRRGHRGGRGASVGQNTLQLLPSAFEEAGSRPAEAGRALQQVLRSVGLVRKEMLTLWPASLPLSGSAGAPGS